jgi:hypothetical protein
MKLRKCAVTDSELENQKISSLLRPQGISQWQADASSERKVTTHSLCIIMARLVKTVETTKDRQGTECVKSHARKFIDGKRFGYTMYDIVSACWRVCQIQQ